MWFHTWLDHRRRPWLVFGRDGDDILLKFTRLATFRVNPERGVVVCDRAHRVPARTLRHLLHNQVLPLVRSADRLVLHASGVVLPRGAVALVGAGGAGKSTLAAALARRGHPLLCDDALEVDMDGAAPVACIGSDTLRIWADTRDVLFGGVRGGRRAAHYSRKQTFPSASLVPTTDQPAALGAVYLVGERETRGAVVAVTPLTPRDALLALLPYAFQLDVKSPERLRQTTERLACLVERVPVYQLRYPRRWRALPDVVSRIEQQEGASH